MERSKLILHTYVGATGRTLTLDITDGARPTSAAIDLQSALITCRLFATYGGTTKIDGKTMTKVVVGENEAGEDGRIAYIPEAAEIDVAGDYEAMVEFALSDGEAEPTYTYDFSDEFTIRVHRVIGTSHVEPEE